MAVDTKGLVSYAGEIKPRYEDLLAKKFVSQGVYDQKQNAYKAAISSHANPWRALTNTPYLVEGEAVVLHPQGAGKWEVLAQLKVEDWTRLATPTPRPHK